MTPSCASHLVLDSITKLPGSSVQDVVVCGSHGGVYAGQYAASRNVKAVIFHDAGIGLQHAGVAGLDILQRSNIPAAAVDFHSACIGKGADVLSHGRISYLNALAKSLGVMAGMSTIDAANLLSNHTPKPTHLPAAPEEHRHMLAPDNGHGLSVYGLDSNSLITHADKEHIVITGSHGGILGTNSASAIAAPVKAAVYNDAGGGKADAGYSRLPALEAMGIPAFTVHHWSARIGDARSTWETGVVSRANNLASNYGIKPGMSVQNAVRLIF